jgi:environmental stress-induced protein Ves
MRLIRSAELSKVPWANGQGITRQIMIDPADANFDDFTWRVSSATIVEAGPFSLLPGIDRILVVVSGHQLSLVVDDAHRDLALHEVFSFKGEAEVHSVASCAFPVIDLNVMTRRGSASAHVAIIDTVANMSFHMPARGTHTLLVSLHQDSTLNDCALDFLDCAILAEEESCTGVGTFAVINIFDD